MEILHWLRILRNNLRKLIFINVHNLGLSMLWSWGMEKMDILIVRLPRISNIGIEYRAIRVLIAISNIVAILTKGVYNKS